MPLPVILSIINWVCFIILMGVLAWMFYKNYQLTKKNLMLVLAARLVFRLHGITVGADPGYPSRLRTIVNEDTLED